MKQFKCGICGQRAPKELLEEGKFKERMEWMRRHYKKNHPSRFKRWGKR